MNPAVVFYEIFRLIAWSVSLSCVKCIFHLSFRDLIRLFLDKSLQVSILLWQETQRL